MSVVSPGPSASSVPTVTRVGRVLRRFHLDGSLQLLNVLCGDMSLVGPRPENPKWRHLYEGDYTALLKMRPGMTGSATLTFLDEQHLLSNAEDRESAYCRDVLPVKLVGDMQFARERGLLRRLPVVALIGAQFLATAVRSIPTWVRRPGKVCLDGATVVVSMLLAHVIRLGVSGTERYLPTIVLLLGPLVVLRLGTLYAFGAYRTFWRYTSVSDLSRIAASTVVSSALFAGFLYAVDRSPASYPRSVFIIEWSLSTLGLLGVRSIRIGGRRVIKSRLVTPSDRTRVLIYGAGDAGAGLAASLLTLPQGRFPVAFIDDDPEKRGALVHGLPVVGDGSAIKEAAKRLGADEVIIAIPSATGEQLRNIVFQGEDLPCRLTTLPSLKEILAGQKRDQIRDVRVEDLLERESVQVDLDAIEGLLSGKRILVTGAGGSIGSELCRQIAAFAPHEMILVGHGENSVFDIQQELLESAAFEVHGVIADIQDRTRLNHIFRSFRPDIVFHAAAHKHVSLMEQNPEEAVKNNILGTMNLAEASVAFGVERFLMVSSDKAVNPTSVMGATKRVAEMVVQTMASQDGVTTKFTAVRFGNVLGSRGSLVPILRRQIAKGGPVTVTHPDMVRYFMTIPEAVQLMLQACAMGGCGEVFVLDMGRPVRIVDLVRNIIRLSGLVVGQDIEIVYTGIRPGEKLFEELLTNSEGATATRHSKVFVARPTPPNPATLSSCIARLETAVAAGDHRAIRETLQQLIPRAKVGQESADCGAGEKNGSEAPASAPEKGGRVMTNGFDSSNHVAVSGGNGAVSSNGSISSNGASAHFEQDSHVRGAGHVSPEPNAT